MLRPMTVTGKGKTGCPVASCVRGGNIFRNKCGLGRPNRTPRENTNGGHQKGGNGISG